jgi:hypothetical protein
MKKNSRIILWNFTLQIYNAINSLTIKGSNQIYKNTQKRRLSAECFYLITINILFI